METLKLANEALENVKQNVPHIPDDSTRIAIKELSIALSSFMQFIIEKEMRLESLEEKDRLTLAELLRVIKKRGF